MKRRIKIQLLSDMCVSDGGVYNSMLNTDICSSPEGFPYIPAKRIRGCLRECALELRDWGYPIRPESLFGDEKDNVSAVRIGDAHLEGIDDLLAQVHAGKGHMLFHRQNILNHYSYIRTQTAINSSTGTADDKSLRTIRVASKGLVFISDVEVRDDLVTALDDCCKVLSGMGIGRTRGLGEVKVSLIPPRKKNGGDNNASNIQAIPALMEGADYLSYEIDLREPMIVKSVRGDQEFSKDYLEGSKVFGYILQCLKKTLGEDCAYSRLKGICCTNAYIKVNGTRGKEIPASYYMVKDTNGTYINRAYETESNRNQFQSHVLVHIKHRYINENTDRSFISTTVDMEQRYHHRRPNDKSIGRAEYKADGNAHFYQISSICPGQTFCGAITGTPEQIRLAYDALVAQPEGLMGYARMSEYGLINVRVTGSDICKKTQLKSVKHLRLSLNSPTILYNNKAMYSISAEDLLEEVCCALGLDKQEIVAKEQYLRYTPISGYNVTWKTRTPVIEGFDKGSTLVLHLKEPKDFNIPQLLMIGERTGEGYGEMEVKALADPLEAYYMGSITEESPVDQSEGVLLKLNDTSYLAQKIAEDLFSSYIRAKAVEQAEITHTSEDERSTISNMLLMAEESKTVQEVRENVRERFDKVTQKKQEKRDVANHILEKVEAVGNGLIREFEDFYGISGYSADKEKAQMAYLRAYLTQLRYKIRYLSNQEGGTERV